MNILPPPPEKLVCITMPPNPRIPREERDTVRPPRRNVPDKKAVYLAVGILGVLSVFATLQLRL